jgi:hypothetical protein
VIDEYVKENEATGSPFEEHHGQGAGAAAEKKGAH